MSCNVFTYGSLMFQAVWEQVVHRHYHSGKAVLEDHARYAIAGASYPGMVSQPGATVEGVLYLDVDTVDIARLDAFEGNEYRRATVQVRFEDGTCMEAHTYLYKATQRLQDTSWKVNEFDIQHFLRAYCPER
ncbi:gamma-glutamylcyclotransferase family protein [Oxalobacteraceae bacterium R-40]|uniref:Putative gamma-glutamylcyclotransferase n=1 Tax=Keguizhuia sedimenti TaxID=3064264 RepID=A0ABU1BSX8_9BURK|nr:gamma-glutamylcyclotransferase family protein [Oxalobacteraceae bacterium R-40]